MLLLLMETFSDYQVIILERVTMIHQLNDIEWSGSVFQLSSSYSLSIVIKVIDDVLSQMKA